MSQEDLTQQYREECAVARMMQRRVRDRSQDAHIEYCALAYGVVWPRWLQVELEGCRDTTEPQALEFFVYGARAVWESLSVEQRAVVVAAENLLRVTRESKRDLSLWRGTEHSLQFAVHAMTGGRDEDADQWARAQESKHRRVALPEWSAIVAENNIGDWWEACEQEPEPLPSTDPRLALLLATVTKRERAVLDCIERGCSLSEAAESLGVAKGTVQEYVNRVRNRARTMLFFCSALDGNLSLMMARVSAGERQRS